MPPLADFLSTFMPSLAWALLDFVWQGMLVGWGAALLFCLMRGARPQARYLVGCGALLLCIALPLSGVIVRMSDAPAPPAVSTMLLPLAGAEPGAAMPQAALAATVQLSGWRDALQERLPLVLALWASGAGLLALRMVLGLAWVRSRSRAGRSTRDPALQARLTRMAQRFGIGRPVALGVVGDLDSPVTAGWWRPVVLVPAALIARIPPELLEALLAHELAHIRRHDYLVNLVQSAIEIVLFYHPTVWWLSGRVRAEREQIADDLAASMLGEPRRLALALSELDRLQLATPTLAHAAHGGNLMTRIQRLVSPTSEPLNWKIAVPILGLAAACAGFYANAAQPSEPGGGRSAAHAAHIASEAGQASAAAAAEAARSASDAARTASRAAAGAARAAKAGSEEAARAARDAARDAAHAARDERKRERHFSRGDDEGEPYAIVRQGDQGSTMHGSSADWGDIKAAQRSINGEFIWFRHGGQAYVIQDPALVAKAHTTWAPVDQLGKQMNGLGDQMKEHGKVMEKLGREMSAAAQKSKPSDARVRQFEQRIQELAGKQAQLASQAATKSISAGRGSDAERKAAEREIDRLESQMNAIEKQIDAESDAFEAYVEKQAHGDMEALGKKMEVAGEPMEKLGEQMDALGERMDVASRAADKAMRALIEDARARGLARPAPRS
ncbi:M56 family metallopeptidase [Pseudoduganella sp. GCM10020061]|uniref:M56 family metallopeptidase n=1 Tax=Pseudoduganella sp. GCM10020061 TaxID=3317345 RepID=UPI00363DD22C